MTDFQNHSSYLNGFLKKSASQLAQNRSSHSPAMTLCRASCPPPCGSAALFQIAPGDLVTIFATICFAEFFPENSFLHETTSGKGRLYS